LDVKTQMFRNADVSTQNFNPQNNRQLLNQQKSLENFEHYESSRSKFANYASCKTQKSVDRGLFIDSDNFRAKQESRELCDLGCSIAEKYGPYNGWKLGLRQNEEQVQLQKKHKGEVTEENEK